MQCQGADACPLVSSPSYKPLILFLDPYNLQEHARLAQASLPAEAAQRMMRALMGYVGEALLAVLTQDSLPAFNLHAVHALANDLGHLSQLCARGLPGLPGLEVGLQLAAPA